MFRILTSQIKIGIAWPASVLGLASMLSDTLQYRSYLHNVINYYQWLFRNPFAGLLDRFLHLDIPVVWVDYAVACSICFTILNWSRSKNSGRDYLTNLVSTWTRFISYLLGLIPFRRSPKKEESLPIWFELPAITILTLWITVQVPAVYLLSPALVVILIFVGVADLIPRRARTLLPQLYFQILRMRTMVERPEQWSKLAESRKQDLLRRLREKTAVPVSEGTTEGISPPRFRSHWDIEDFFGTRGAPAITRNTNIAIEIQRDILRDGSFEVLRAAAFFVASFFALIAISLKF